VHQPHFGPRRQKHCSKVRQARIYSRDDDDADVELHDVLLILKILIGRDEYLESLRRTFAILNRRPPSS